MLAPPNGKPGINKAILRRPLLSESDTGSFIGRSRATSTSHRASPRERDHDGGFHAVFLGPTLAKTPRVRPNPCLAPGEQARLVGMKTAACCGWGRQGPAGSY